MDGGVGGRAAGGGLRGEPGELRHAVFGVLVEAKGKRAEQRAGGVNGDPAGVEGEVSLNARAVGITVLPLLDTESRDGVLAVFEYLHDAVRLAGQRAPHGQGVVHGESLSMVCARGRSIDRLHYDRRFLRSRKGHPPTQESGIIG